MRVTVRNARFQRWQALASSRSKRTSSGEFLVQGVRPINAAVRSGWAISALLFDADRRLSSWAGELIARPGVEAVAMSSELLAELGGKEADAVEIVAVVRMPPDDLNRIPLGERATVVVLDRPSSPGNIGTVVRSADAFGARGVVVAGHAADVYDPKSVRASTGSLFAVPVVRVGSAADVIGWAKPAGLIVVGLDETGSISIAEVDLARPCLLVVGSESRGLSVAWREASDVLARIPMSGTASSLNAASAATVALYEATRQKT